MERSTMQNKKERNKENISIIFPKNILYLLVAAMIVIAAIMFYRDVLSPGADIVEKNLDTIKEIPTKILAEKDLDKEAITAVEEQFSEYDVERKFSLVTKKQIPSGTDALRFMSEYDDFIGTKRIVLVEKLFPPFSISAILLIKKTNGWYAINDPNFFRN